MFVLRLVALLALLTIVGGFAAYLLTRNPAWLRFSWQVFLLALGSSLLVFALLVVERLLVVTL